MLVYYFVPFIVSNRFLLFWVSNGHNLVTDQNRTHVYMSFFDHKHLGNHLLQLWSNVVKHPVYFGTYLKSRVRVMNDRYFKKRSVCHFFATRVQRETKNRPGFVFRWRTVRNFGDHNGGKSVVLYPWSLENFCSFSLWIRVFLGRGRESHCLWTVIWIR